MWHVTWWSSCLSRLDRDSTHVSRDESCGSILLQSRDTTAIAECNVSLCTRWPLSLMKLRTQFSPPASNTAPDSRVQISSSTYEDKMHNCMTKINMCSIPILPIPIQCVFYAQAGQNNLLSSTTWFYTNFTAPRVNLLVPHICWFYLS